MATSNYRQNYSDGNSIGIKRISGSVLAREAHQRRKPHSSSKHCRIFLSTTTTTTKSQRLGFRFGAKAMAEVVKMAIDGEYESKPNGQDQPKKTLKRKRATLTPKQQQQLFNIRGEQKGAKIEE
jgi:hypothetical protein